MVDRLYGIIYLLFIHDVPMLQQWVERRWLVCENTGIVYEHDRHPMVGMQRVLG